MLACARAPARRNADAAALDSLAVWGQQRQICTDIAFGIAIGESKSCCFRVNETGNKTPEKMDLIGFMWIFIHQKS